MSSVYHLTQRLLVEAHTRGGGVTQGVDFVHKRLNVRVAVYNAVFTLPYVEPLSKSDVIVIRLCFLLSRFD